MREVLIDHARRRAAGRRGGGRRRVALDAVVDYLEEQGLDVVAVHEALDRLAELDGRQAQVMTLRYLGGMTVAEVAAALGISVTTVEHDWRLGADLARRAKKEWGNNEKKKGNRSANCSRPRSRSIPPGGSHGSAPPATATTTYGTKSAACWPWTSGRTASGS